MEFHYYQIPSMLFTAFTGYFAGYLIYYLWNNKLKKAKRAAKIIFFFLILMLISVNFTPIKLTEHNMSIHEETKFNPIDKITVKEVNFKTLQTDELNQLKKESKNALK